MNKQISKKTRKILSSLLIAGFLGETTSTLSFADEKIDMTSMPGFLTIEAEYGDTLIKEDGLDSAVIRDANTYRLVNKEDVTLNLEQENTEKGKYLFGIPLFNNLPVNKDIAEDDEIVENTESTKDLSVFHVDSFISWLNENYDEFKDIFTEDLDTTNDLELINAFEKANELDSYTFAYAQQYYYLESAIYPVIERIHEKTVIDFSKDRALEELAYSTIVQFGETGALKLVENAVEAGNITNESDSEEIVETIQKYRIKKYETLAGASDEVKEALINKTNESTDDYLELIGQETSKEAFENKDAEKVEAEIEENKSILAMFGNIFSFLNR